MGRGGGSKAVWEFSKKTSKLGNPVTPKIPRVGGAEKLKPQEAIPPFSLIEVSIHGMRAETLVKTV